MHRSHHRPSRARPENETLRLCLFANAWMGLILYAVLDTLMR